MRIYEFGGAVRDRLLGLEPKDIDYLVLDSSEDEFLNVFPAAKKVGRENSVFLLHGAQYTVCAGNDIRAELQKKDLTINSLAQDSQGKLISTAQARNDLQQQILRPVSRENFLQDPVRVLRAARIHACLPAFQVHKELLQAMQDVARSHFLHKAVAERVGQEICQACTCASPSNFLRLLAKTGNLLPWLAELDQAQNIPAGPERADKNLLEHICDVLDKAAGDPLLVWMALGHDLGKTKTNPAYWPRHYLHDFLGGKLVRRLGQRLRMPNRYIRAAELAAAWHLAASGYHRLAPKPKIRLLLTLHKKKLFQKFFLLLQLIQGPDLQQRAGLDLKNILQVRLPRKYRDLGPVSGAILKDLQAKAISRSSKCNSKNQFRKQNL